MCQFARDDTNCNNLYSEHLASRLITQHIYVVNYKGHSTHHQKIYWDSHGKESWYRVLQTYSLLYALSWHSFVCGHNWAKLLETRIVKTRVPQIFQKYRLNLKILGVRRVTRSKFHSKDRQILGATLQHLVAREILAVRVWAPLINKYVLPTIIKGKLDRLCTPSIEYAAVQKLNLKKLLTYWPGAKVRWIKF
jgi:hypothetical protein